jgi:hypothetical protein
MRGRLFTVLSALSLLLCMGTVVQHFGCGISIVGPPLWVSHGWAYEIGTGEFSKDPDWSRMPTSTWRHFGDGGFLVTWTEPGEIRPRFAVRVPDDLVVPVSAILPAIWFVFSMIRFLGSRRPLPGKCTSCGYDLRATPGRCPECGAIPSAAKVKP